MSSHPSNKDQKGLADKLTAPDADARWQDKASCKGMDPILFFGPEYAETVKEKRDREDAAKEVCHTCPVNKDCLEYALDAREAYGIWGGMTESERKALLRKRAS